MSIIEKLSEEMIVDFWIHDNMLSIHQRGHDYAGVSLTKEESIQLIEELKELVNKLD